MKPILRDEAEGFRIVAVDRNFWSEVYVTGHFSGARTLNESQVSLLGKLLKPGSSAHISIFGGDSGLPERLAPFLSGINSRVDRFVFSSKDEAGFFSINILILRPGNGAELSEKVFPDGSKGWALKAIGAQMGYLSGVKSSNKIPIEAYEETYEWTVSRIMGMGFRAGDLTRTWCYFSDILAEYKAFNEVRRQVFERYDIMSGLLPASTGIQGVIDTGEQLIMHALAYSGPEVECRRILNPNQQEAIQYGSLFSRGIMVSGIGPDQLIVSGLAAIGSNGETLHVGDPIAQMNSTIENAERLMDEAGYSWSDCVSGIIYIKPEYFSTIAARLPQTAMNNLPFCLTTADVCRSDLMFELECTAFKS